MTVYEKNESGKPVCFRVSGMRFTTANFLCAEIMSASDRTTGFNAFMSRYKADLSAEQAASEV